MSDAAAPDQGASGGATTATPAVELRGITKRFPGVVANQDVDLVVQPGTVHAIVGENGAGKSTLMKTLYGVHRADEGTMHVEGREVKFASPKDAIASGIGMVHQHFMLADQLTVLENIILGSEPGSAVRIDLDRARADVAKLSNRYQMHLDPDELVEDLEVGQRQRVEIIKVLYRGAQILVLDEPTAVLVPQEVHELFANLRELRAEGKTVIFISHKLDEVLAIADTITVIRRGRTVGTVEPDEVTARDLAEMMVGSQLPTPETHESTVRDTVALSVRELGVQDAVGRWRLHDIAFDVRAGEVVGVAGVEGNGQADLIDVLLGLTDATTGSVLLRTRDADELVDATGWSTRRRREHGVAYIPEDRHRRGLLLTQPLWENALLGHQSSAELSNGPWIDRGAARTRTERIVADYDVRTPNIDVTAHALSGGNQQKFIIGREMESSPTLLIAAHPTRGIDVGAQASVWDLLRDARADGLAVLLVSADLDELIGLSDTLHVILRGRFVAQLDPSDVTPEILGSYMTGAADQEAAS